MSKVVRKILFILGIVLLFYWFETSKFSQYLTLDYLKSQKEQLILSYSESRSLYLLIYFILYILVAALSIPGATVLTLGGGAVFGFWMSFLLVSFASTLGATLAFLSSRFLFREWVLRRFGQILGKIDEGLKDNGVFYLFSLRLIPAFPFFLVNLIMGLTKIPVWTFYWVSQLGMLLGTAVYVNAGTQLSRIESISDILTPQIFGSFVLIGLMPWISKKILAKVQKKNEKIS